MLEVVFWACKNWKNKPQCLFKLARTFYFYFSMNFPKCKYIFPVCSLHPSGHFIMKQMAFFVYLCQIGGRKWLWLVFLRSEAATTGLHLKQIALISSWNMRPETSVCVSTKTQLQALNISSSLVLYWQSKWENHARGKQACVPLKPLGLEFAVWYSNYAM